MSGNQDPRAQRYWVPERVRPADDPAAPHRLWRVETATSVKDPRETGDGAWDGCRVLAFTARFMGGRTVLVEATNAAAARLRTVPGVRSVEPSPDRRYFDDRCFDDRSERQVTVSARRIRSGVEP